MYIYIYFQLYLSIWTSGTGISFKNNFNPIQDGGSKSPPPTSFFPVTSTNLGINPPIFLTFSSNPFDRLV